MRAIILFGSPRKNGNTIQLAQGVMKALKEKESYVRMLYLNDLNIRPCQGCYKCLGDGTCRINDDMKDIRKYIIESDVIVYATPVYWFSPSAQLKVVMDRSIAFMNGDNSSRIAGKKAITLMTFADKNTDTAISAVMIFKKSFELLQLDYIGGIEAPGCSGHKNLTQKYQKEMKRLVSSLI